MKNIIKILTALATVAGVIYSIARETKLFMPESPSPKAEETAVSGASEK